MVNTENIIFVPVSGALEQTQEEPKHCYQWVSETASQGFIGNMRSFI